jgi:prepilin-type N-terminal cleavage/methylation domain-containing protein
VAGFTLLETLVAMTVLALLASVLLRGVLAVRADASWFADRTAQTLLARSILDEAIANRRLRDGIYRGRRDGRRFVLTAASAVAPAAEAGPDRPAGHDGMPTWRPQRVSVAVEAPSRPVVLETLRLVTP